MSPTGGGSVWGPIASKLARQALSKLSKALRDKVQQVSRAAGATSSELEPILVRNSPKQPLSRAAAIRQGRGRWYSTHSAVRAAVRQYTSIARTHSLRADKASFPKSRTSSAVSQLTCRAPFASTLRPNLTGGTLSRTAGGYSLGGGRMGGARYFSHTPAAPAQIVENVSSAARAFWLSGQKARFDGCTSRGEKRFRSISNNQARVIENIKSVSKFSPGSYVDFQVSPTVTALSPLSMAFPHESSNTSAPNLNTSGFLDVLSVDFSRALSHLAAVMNDLKKLATLGNLSVELASPTVIRVRFPGCDADTVESLCQEVCVTRGLVREDEDFNASTGVQIALMFPFAPTTTPPTMSSPGGSLRSNNNLDDQSHGEDSFDLASIVESYQSHSLSDCDGLEESETGSAYFSKTHSHANSSQDYEGLEGIYRFINQCDAARRVV